MYLYISDILLYKPPNPAYAGDFLHTNNQRAHNNYKNIILKEPNENPQRGFGQFGPAGHVMDNTALINGIIVDYERATN